MVSASISEALYSDVVPCALLRCADDWECADQSGCRMSSSRCSAEEAVPSLDSDGGAESLIEPRRRRVCCCDICEREGERERREQIFQIRFVAKCVKAFSISVRAGEGKGYKDSRAVRFLWLSNAMEFVFTRSKLAEPKLNLIQKNTDEFPARVLSLCALSTLQFSVYAFPFALIRIFTFRFCCCLLCSSAAAAAAAARLEIINNQFPLPEL